MKTQNSVPAWLLKSLLGAQRLVEKKIYNSMSVMSSRGPLAAERPQTQEAVGAGERSREGTRKHPGGSGVAFPWAVWPWPLPGLRRSGEETVRKKGSPSRVREWVRQERTRSSGGASDPQGGRGGGRNHHTFKHLGSIRPSFSGGARRLLAARPGTISLILSGGGGGAHPLVHPLLCTNASMPNATR